MSTVVLLFLTLNVRGQQLGVSAPASRGIWTSETGAPGFRQFANELNLSVGAGFGMAVITSPRTHDWAIASLQYGCVFSGVVAPDHWWRGNWEILGQLFGGEQFYPSSAYFIGGGPLLRYDFAASRRFVPFIDLGAGVTATDIRNGDLSTTFEFNLQGGAGAHYFLRDDLALTFQYRFIHLSNAGMQFPNLGVNNSSFLLGLTWFF